MEESAFPEELKPLIAFHGHYCPGILVGWRASRLALKLLGTTRDRDEEMTAIVENDACGVDAIQFVLGCTFSKGNFPSGITASTSLPCSEGRTEKGRLS